MQYKTQYEARCEGNQEILFWINHNLSNYLQKNQENCAEIEHIIDYFLASKRDRLRKMSYKDAKIQSEKWVESMKKKANGVVELETDTKTIISFKNGFKLVRLVGEAAYKREGLLMSHCVSSYFGKKEVGVYSLRDNNNNPHCTMELVRNNGSINQIKGKGNGPIHPKYIAGVLASLKKLTKGEIRDIEMSNLGYVSVDAEVSRLLDGYNGAKFITFNGKKYFYIHS